MSLSKPSVDLRDRPFDLPETHPAERLFKRYPQLLTIAAVREFFRLIEECYGRAARTAARRGLFPEDAHLCLRGLMILSGLDPVMILTDDEQRPIFPIQLYKRAEVAIHYHGRNVPGVQQKTLEGFRKVSGSLLYGILAAAKAA